jgi:KaiC/GvpD/RAD55 family RecA-like ATPase
VKEELTPMDIIEDHLPSGISTLIVGPPGSGKTILSQQLILQVLRRRMSAIFIAPKSQISPIVSQKKLFSWNVASFMKNDQFTTVEIGDVADPTELNISLTQAIKTSRRPLSLVVVDSLTVLMVGMEERKIMKFAEALTRKLQDQNVGLLLLITPTKETDDFLTKMKSLASSVIEIKLEERGTIRRYIRIFKFQERKHSTQWFPFEITDQGIQFAAAPVRPLSSNMVFLPKIMLLEETSTPYSGLERLTDRIKKEKLSCILETQFSSGQGIMLFIDGDCIKSVLIGKDGKRAQAPQLLEASIRTKEGRLTVHSIRPEIIPLLIGYVDDQVLFRNLNSDQIKFEDIVENLSESEFSGTMHLRSDEEQGLIFIDEGKVIDAYFENEHALYSKEAISAFEDAALRGNFQIDIFFSPRAKKMAPGAEKMVQVSEPEEAVLPEFIPVKGLTVQGAFINATFKYLQEQNRQEWSSTVYYPRPLQDVAINKVENEIVRLKGMKDPYLKRKTYKLRQSYRDREWYPADEYFDIVYTATRMLEFSWTYENHDQYEEGWGKLSKAYFELGKTIFSSMGVQKKVKKNEWFDQFIKEIKKWKDMGSFSELESEKEDKKLVLKFKKDLEPPPRRKGMLWGLLEGLGLSKFTINIEDENYIITFG